MKPGTPGFVGERLREAREARSISAIALAEQLGISRAALSQYETNQASTRPDVMRRIAEVLNVPPGFFLKPARPDRPRKVFFRSRAAATKMAREKGRKRLHWLADIVIALCDHVRLPQLRFSPFEPPTDPKRLSMEEIEQKTKATRRYWELGDGPISNIVWLLENAGAIVTRGEFHEDKMDSFSRWEPDDPAPLVFLNADRASAVRSRFDAAHELGHLLLHRGVPDEYWGPEISLRESQASKFACAFLLPRAAFGDEVIVPSLDPFLALKPKWLVSIAAMIMRSEDIGLISDDHVSHLWRNLGRRKWRTREPLDDKIEPEIPRLLRRAFEVISDHNPTIVETVLTETQLSEIDVAQLAMLPSGFFELERDPKIIAFPRRY